MDCEQILKELTCIPSVSGKERGMRRLLLSFFPYGKTDEAGNLIVQLTPGKTRILIDAHMDEVGFKKTEKKISTVGDIEHYDPKDISWRGSSGFFRRTFTRKGDIIMSPGLDNKVGMAAIILATESITAPGIMLAFSTQEETDQRGIRHLSNKIDPDLFICVDAAYAGMKEKGWIIPRIGKGCAFQTQGTNFTLDKGWVQDIANKKKIPLQEERIKEGGGTNLSAVPWTCKKAQINIPVKDQHMPVSTCDINDIIWAAQLIAAVVESCQTGGT